MKKNKNRNTMIKSKCFLFLLNVFVFLLIDTSMNAQFIHSSARNDTVIPEELDFCDSRMALVNARTWESLTPEQIACLGEYGFDTTNYYAKCKNLRLVRNLSAVGILSFALGGIGLFAWTDQDEEGNVVYNQGRLIAGGSCMGISLGGIIGLGVYLINETSELIDEAEKARIKIGATDSRLGLAYVF